MGFNSAFKGLNACVRNETSLQATGRSEVLNAYNCTPRQFHSSGVSPRSLGSFPDETMELVPGAVLTWRTYRRICSVFAPLITIQPFFHTHLYPYITYIYIPISHTFISLYHILEP